MMEEKYREAFASVHPSEALKQRTLEEMKRAQRARARARWLRPLGAAAACFAVFAAGVNASPAFAQAVEGIPVVGGLARVLSVRSYTEQDESKTITVDQPALDPEAGDVALDVNARIQQAVDDYLKEANARVAAEKEAFLATGGTEQEFAARGVEITVDYEILSQSEERLSFVLRAAQSDINAFKEIRYYNLDLHTGKELTLEDVLGEDYARIADTAISEQMAARPEVPYFAKEAGGFAGVDPNTAFYLNQDGNPVVVFERYAIAPGGYGPQEFEIKR
jgi:hypothetical protein